MTEILPSPSLQRFVAARHVLTSPSIAALTRPHIGAGDIDWVGVAAETATMSGGERYLVDIARRLYAGEALPDAYELHGQLDVLNARRVGEALASLSDADEPPSLARAA
jgi:hypothetical protein